MPCFRRRALGADNSFLLTSDMAQELTDFISHLHVSVPRMIKVRDSRLPLLISTDAASEGDCCEAYIGGVMFDDDAFEFSSETVSRHSFAQSKVRLTMLLLC